MAHGVKVIQLGGKERVVNLNLHAMSILLKELSCDLETLPDKMVEIGADFPIRAMAYVVYAGLIGHHESEAEFIHDVTLKNVMKWMGESDNANYGEIWDWFKEVNGIPNASTEQMAAYSEHIKKKGIKQESTTTES